MGNQQTKKHEAQVQIIQKVGVQLKQVTPKQDSFVQQIQNENQKNVNQRKCTIHVIVQNTSVTTANNTAPRLSKKQLSKKELPPLKLKKNSMKSTPLGNCQNITNQANLGIEQMEEISCQKGHKMTANNFNDQVLDQVNDKESEGQKENNEAAMNVRAKKFRPSQQSSGKKTIIGSTAFVNEARQLSQLDEVTAV